MDRWIGRCILATLVLVWAITVAQIVLVGGYSVKQFAFELFLTVVGLYTRQLLLESADKPAKPRRQ